MTTIALPRHTINAPSERIPFWFALVVIARRIRRRARIRSDRKLLQAMPDHLLADIGISRGQIDSAVECGRSARR